MMENNPVKSVIFLLCLGIVLFFGGLAIIPPCIVLLIVPYGVFITTTVINFFVASFCALIPGILELVFGVEVKVCGDLKKLHGPCLIIMNHRTRLDWMFFWCYLIRMGDLQKLKIMLKAGLRRVPVAGWAMQTALYFFVSRKWVVDEEQIKTRLQYFRDTDFPLQFLLFPEGTDLSPSNREKSNRYADSYDLQKYDYVLHPKFKGFRVCVEEMSKARLPLTIVNMSVGYAGTIVQNETDLAVGKWPTEIHFFAEQIPYSALPSDESGLIDWLEKCWADKEKQLKLFYKTEKFSAQYLSGPMADKGLNFARLVMVMWTVFLVLVFYSLATSWVLWIYYSTMTALCILSDKYSGGLDWLVLRRYQLTRQN